MNSGQIIAIVILILAIAIAGAILALAVYRRKQEPEISNEATESEEKRSEGTFAAVLAVGIALGSAQGAIK